MTLERRGRLMRNNVILATSVRQDDKLIQCAEKSLKRLVTVPQAVIKRILASCGLQKMVFSPLVESAIAASWSGTHWAEEQSKTTEELALENKDLRRSILLCRKVKSSLFRAVGTLPVTLSTCFSYLEVPVAESPYTECTWAKDHHRRIRCAREEVLGPDSDSDYDDTHFPI